jgi:hypothetical protein
MRSSPTTRVGGKGHEKGGPGKEWGLRKERGGGVRGGARLAAAAARPPAGTRRRRPRRPLPPARAPPGEGRVRVTLADGRSEEFDLLVGADGIWSKIRKEIVGETKVRARPRPRAAGGGLRPAHRRAAVPATA